MLGSPCPVLSGTPKRLQKSRCRCRTPTLSGRERGRSPADRFRERRKCLANRSVPGLPFRPVFDATPRPTPRQGRLRQTGCVAGGGVGGLPVPVVAVGAGGCCGDARHSSELWCRGGIWALGAPFCRGFPGLRGSGAVAGGGVAAGAGWVYCFLSRREGDQRKAGNRRRPIP